MIYSISCDKPSFKRVDFKPGLNVALAERTKDSTKKDSRNGLGKSTLIEIIHFCLGGGKGETLSKQQLDGWSFTLDLDIGKKRYSITRNTADQNKVIIDGDCSDWPLKPENDEKTNEQIMSSRDWNKVLGLFMFGLQLSYPDLNYAPTFRSIISYFVRRNGARGGFLNPFQQHKSQQEWDKQVNNAFLLDLNWGYAAKWQVIKDRIKVINQIKQEAKTGMLANLMGTIGELDALKIRLESQARSEEKQLNNFNVHPQYKKIEEETNELTFHSHELVNLNINDRRILEYYERSLKEEAEAKAEDITRMFTEAGVIMPGSVTKRVGDVLSFHKQVVANRKEFLTQEMERLTRNIAERETEISKLSGERAKLMQILKKHKALDEILLLQNKHQETIAQIKDLDIKIENLKKFEQGKNAVIVEQALLQQQATTDLNERKNQKEQAILLFNSNSNALYDSPGIFSIDASPTGYKFNVKIERSGSHGIGNMKIFCYDLMLAQMWAEKACSPIFLIHDSIIFADVDERQKALALELAAKESKERGFQYICTLNSDGIPEKDFSKDFDFSSYVRKVFTDATEDGGILGIRF
ncbi:MAG: DUF2326 domain-containing protein [Syntrophorhabdaceae bacterium]|nr:DUF2326 domain-containing protein [Candidatus Paceibacterota bacterium]MDD5242436.1 DUF2326 domain-containing protein [Syntrophorhabdaceae bacterium]